MQDFLRRVLRAWEKRLPLDPAQLEALGDEAYLRGWGLAGIWEQKFLERIQGSLTTAIAKGTTYSEWTQEEAQKILDGFGAGVSTYRGGKRWAPWYSELVMRNATQASFAGGRYSAMFAPEWQQIAPFVQYLATQDERTRPAHAALHGKVFRKDDPAARYYFPPLGHNCRCSLIELTLAEVEDAGYQITAGNMIPLLPTSDGRMVGRPPGGWDVDRVAANGSKTLELAAMESLRGAGPRGRARVFPESAPLLGPDAVEPLLEERLQGIERGLTSIRTHERAMLVAEDGTIVWKRRGATESTRSGVVHSVNVRGMPSSEGRRLVFTHNHVKGASFSLAGGDFTVAEKHDVWMVRAVSSDQALRWRYVVTRPSVGWPSAGVLHAAEYEADLRVRTSRDWELEFRRFAYLPDKEREAAVAALRAEQSHLVVEALCRIIGAGYERTSWG